MNRSAYPDSHLTLTPRDPVIARDGRPFGSGTRMRSLDWLFPSVAAGSLRTLLGHLDGAFVPSLGPRDPDAYERTVSSLKALSVAGPFPVVDNQVYFPAPQDVTVRRNEDGTIEAFASRPVPLRVSMPGTGCDLPVGLDPALLPKDIGEDFKPVPPPAFWSCEEVSRWLANANGRGLLPSGVTDWPASGYIMTPKKDVRTHVQMDPVSGIGAEGMLFQTTGLDLGSFPRPDERESRSVRALDGTLSMRVRPSPSGDYRATLKELDTLHPLGGERRLIHWRHITLPPVGWQCPRNVAAALKGARGIRMVLATPAVFEDGWKPGWVQPDGDPEQLVGEWMPAGMRLRLISACIARWQPLSGWDYERKGPKAIRRVVPAGSVYFFEVLGGAPEGLAEHWLESVCDDSQDQRDGLGLALWGIWSAAEANQSFW